MHAAGPQTASRPREQLTAGAGMQEHACIGHVRGAGLMIGVEFVTPSTTQHAPDIAAKVQATGLPAQALHMCVMLR